MISSPVVPPLLRSWRLRILFTCWTMYASYYLARMNLALAQPLIRDDLGLDDKAMGWIATTLMLSYGIGQAINGFLGDRFGPRRFASVGMLVSAAANVAFGFGTTLPWLGIAWAVNGFAQSTGAPMRIKAIANWIPHRERGRMMGFAGTDGSVGNVLCWVLVGLWILPHYGWRAAFFVPAALLALSALHFWWRVRDQPEDVGFPSLEEQEGRAPAAEGSERVDWRFVVRQSFGNPRVWLVGFAYFGVDFIRYGFVAWAPTFLHDAGGEVSSTALKMLMMPLFAIPAVIVSGWLTDRIGGRRAPVIAVMLFLCGGAAALFPAAAAHGPVAAMACLGALGFFLYGPHLLMGATLAMDLGSRKASGAASGLIDALGYAGAAVATLGVPYLKEAFSWNVAFGVLVGGAVLAGLLMLLLWNWKPEADRAYV